MRATIKIDSKRGPVSVLCKLVEGGRFLELCPGEEIGSDVTIRECWCPTCATMHALRSGVRPAAGDVPRDPGTVRGLSEDLSKLLAHQGELERQWGPLEREDPPYGPARVVLPKPEEYTHGYRGIAECERCRQPLGTLTIETSLFGHEEDARILGESRRWRVY